MKPIFFTLLTAHCSLLTLAAQPPQPFGKGTITRDSGGRVAVTQPHGKGTITRFSDGKVAVTTPFGKQSVTRFSDGRVLFTSPHGPQKNVAAVYDRRTSTNAPTPRK